MFDEEEEKEGWKEGEEEREGAKERNKRKETMKQLIMTIEEDDGSKKALPS